MINKNYVYENIIVNKNQDGEPGFGTKRGNFEEACRNQVWPDTLVAGRSGSFCNRRCARRSLRLSPLNATGAPVWGSILHQGS